VLTVKKDAAAGTYYIEATCGEAATVVLTVTVGREGAAANSVSVSGPSAASVHSAQGASASYTAAVTDQYGDVIANPNALGFYERVGFEVTGQASTRFGDAPRMTLDLSRR
jgi:hypothetical protein